MDEKLYTFDSKYRVALDLMYAIAEEEDKKTFAKPDPRTYYLKLYGQCLKAVSDGAAEIASSPRRFSESL
jgi:hypothetical protein